MKDIFSKTISFLNLYKWLILLCIPIIFFIWFILNLFSTSPVANPKETTSLTITPFETKLPTSQPSQSNIETEEQESYTEVEQTDNFQKKEVRNDGSILYTSASGNPQRPNILITDSNDQLIFSRTLTSEDLPLVNISVLKEDFGEPEKIVSGTKFFGHSTSLFIYSSQGFAFIGDTQTDKIIEEQHFSPMSVDAYLQRFSEQN